MMMNIYNNNNKRIKLSTLIHNLAKYKISKLQNQNHKLFFKNIPLRVGGLGSNNNH